MSIDNDNARSLFDKAKDLPKQAQEAFLSELNDDDLRGEVESLLAYHQPSVPLTNIQAQSLDQKPGDLIDSFKILDVLGEGGMGTVYLAEQSKPILRRVALKIIKAGMDTKQVIARFESERQALAIMDHQGIAKVYEAGVTEYGRPYFAMEFVKGSQIIDACNEQKLNTTQRLELFAKVCDAVQHAHIKGIIHRDLKPANILVSMGDDDLLQPKIIDFGVAKAINYQLTDKTLFTQVGRFIGTPAYMSPEQADLKTIDIDTRTDVYALGIILYELLTGITPFNPETLRDAGLAKMREIIRTQEAPKPSTVISSFNEENVRNNFADTHQIQIDELAGLLRKELEWIPLKAIRKKRSERYDSAKSMGDDVRRYLNNEALDAGPESFVYKSRKFLHRHIQLVAGILFFLICFNLVIFISSHFVAKAQQQSELAKQQSIIAEEERARNSAMAEYSFKSLSPGMSGTTMQQNKTFWKSHIRVLQNEINELFSADPRQQANMYAALARSKLAVNALGTGGSERAALFQKAADVLRTNDSYDEAQALLYELQAQVVKFEDEPDDVQLKFASIMELQPDNVIKAETFMMFAWFELKLTHVSYPVVQQGHAHAEQARRLFASLGELYDSKQLSVMKNQVWSYLFRDASNDKLTEEQKSYQLEQGKSLILNHYLALAEKVDGGRSNNYYDGLGLLALVLDREGNIQEAIDANEQLLEYKLEYLGDGHNSTWQTMSNLAINYCRLSTQTDSQSEKRQLRQKSMELMLTVIAQTIPRGGDTDWYKRVFDYYFPEYAPDESGYNEWMEALKLSPTEFVTKYVNKLGSDDNSSNEELKPD